MAASSTALANDRYSTGHRHRSPPSTSLIHSVFNFTVKTAAKTLVSISSTNSRPSDHTTKWGPTDHLRFVFMLTAWLALWFLRLLMDHFPSFSGSSNYNNTNTPLSYQYHLHGGGGGPVITNVVPYEYSPLLTSSSSSASSSVVQSTLSALLPLTSVQGSMDIILHHQGAAEPSVDAIGRALTHTLGLLSEIPATSRKYQFTQEMADRIMDDNARDGHVELLHINRVALSSTFARTSALLYRSLQQTHDSHKGGGWATQVVQSLPLLGPHIVPYVKGVNLCLDTLLKFTGNGGRHVSLYGGGNGGGMEEEEVVAEKLAQELLWIATKMRDYGVVDEALQQWSFDSGLASASLTASPRVQGFIIKTFVVLFGDLEQDMFVAPRHVKFGMLLLWLPLCCHSSNGLSYPILTRSEKVEIERAMDAVIDTLPYTDQELILTNWLQDYAVSNSDWPNLQAAYDRWCHSSRKSV